MYFIRILVIGTHIWISFIRLLWEQTQRKKIMIQPTANISSKGHNLFHFFKFRSFKADCMVWAFRIVKVHTVAYNYFHPICLNCDEKVYHLHTYQIFLFNLKIIGASLMNSTFIFIVSHSGAGFTNKVLLRIIVSKLNCSWLTINLSR